MISSCAGTDALCLRNIRHSATPYSAFNTSPIFARSRSELNFVFSISPTRLPSSDAGRSTYAMVCIATSAVGSRSSIIVWPPWCGNSNQAHHATEQGRAQVFEKPKHPGDRLMWRRAALHHVLGQNTDRRRTEECGTGGARTSIQSVSRTQWSSRYSSSLPASHRPAGNSSRPGGRATGATSGAAVRRRLCVLTRTEPALDKLKFDLTADCARCASECFESHGMAVRVKESVKLAPASLHPAGHLRLGETLLLHGLLNLPGENPLNGKALGRFVGPLVLQKVIKGGANAGLLRCPLPHCSISFMRLRARVT